MIVIVMLKLMPLLMMVRIESEDEEDEEEDDDPHHGAVGDDQRRLKGEAPNHIGERPHNISVTRATVQGRQHTQSYTLLPIA